MEGTITMNKETCRKYSRLDSAGNPAGEKRP